MLCNLIGQYFLYFLTIDQKTLHGTHNNTIIVTMATKDKGKKCLFC